MPDNQKIMDWAEITLTSRCNQRCFFCYEESRDVAAEPALEEVKRILRETRKSADQAVLCGKEVLLRPDVLEIVQYGHSLGLRVVVFSNGQAFAKPGMVSQLVQAGCDSVVVSFHFPDEATFELGARTKKSGFKRQMEGLRALRNYNDAHPEHPLHVSTETDMFVMNAGRLAEMRQVLVEHLGTTNWSMRLGSLLPSKVYDIGLDSLLEPMAQRRQELQEFFGTHPSSIPLNVVKSPLCLIPAEYRHLSLELGYLAKGAGLTFNHETQANVTVDTMSISATRDVERHLLEFPYRWVCRHCALVRVCRFERTSWMFKGFQASLAQKPWPVSRDQAAELLGKNGGVRNEGLEGVGSGVLPGLSGDLGRESGMFPEESILAALGDAVLEGWATEAPGLGVALQIRGQRVELRLEMPRIRSAGEAAGFVVQYLFVTPLNTSEMAEGVWVEALRRVGQVSFPALSTWTGTPLVDLDAAATLQQGYLLLGEAMWPGLGRLGTWRTTELQRPPDGSVRVTLSHPSGCWASVWLVQDQVRVVLHEVRPELYEAAYAELLGWLSGHLEATTGKLPELGPNVENRRIYLARTKDGWVRTDARGGIPEPDSEAGADPSAPLAARLEDAVTGRTRQRSWAPSGGQLRWVVSVGGNSSVELRFGVAPFTEGAAFLQRVGERVVWYKGRVETAESKLFARILVAVMKHLEQAPLTAEALPVWESAVQQVIQKNSLQSRIRAKAYWEEE